MSKYGLYVDNGHSEDEFPVRSLSEGLELAKDILIGWMEEELASWRMVDGEYAPTPVDIENWNFMIENCEVYVVDYRQIESMEFFDATTDEYYYSEGHYYYPLKKAQKLGWVERSVA